MRPRNSVSYNPGWVQESNLVRKSVLVVGCWTGASIRATVNREWGKDGGNCKVCGCGASETSAMPVNVNYVHWVTLSNTNQGMHMISSRLFHGEWPGRVMDLQMAISRYNYNVRNKAYCLLVEKIADDLHACRCVPTALKRKDKRLMNPVPMDIKPLTDVTTFIRRTPDYQLTHV